MKKGTSTPYRRVLPEKSTVIVANTVANVIAALLMSGEGKDRSLDKITGKWVMTHLDCHRHDIACHLTTQKNFWDMFLAHSVQAKPRE